MECCTGPRLRSWGEAVAVQMCEGDQGSALLSCGLPHGICEREARQPRHCCVGALQCYKYGHRPALEVQSGIANLASSAPQEHGATQRDVVPRYDSMGAGLCLVMTAMGQLQALLLSTKQAVLPKGEVTAAYLDIARSCRSRCVIGPAMTPPEKIDEQREDTVHCRDKPSCIRER